MPDSQIPVLQVLAVLTKAGFMIEPPAHPGQESGRPGGDTTWFYIGDWREGTLGRPGWPINGTRVVVPDDPDESIEIYTFDGSGGCTGGAQITGGLRLQVIEGMFG